MSKKNKYQNIANETCKQAVIFARVSSEEQKRGASIDAQIKTVKNYCNTKKLKVLDTFDIVESSTNGGRKKFYEMLEFVKQQKHKTAIVVNCIDRLQRGYKENVALDELREQGRIELHFYKEGLIITQNSNSSDIMRWDIGIFAAKTYVGALRDNVLRSQEYKRENGQWMSCAPVGYLNVPKTDKTPADIVIDPDRAPKVKRLFEEYAKGGRTLQDITNLARSLGLCSKMCTVNKTISRAQVRNILKNPFYIGYFINKGKTYKHNYPLFIDKELFQIVQDMMAGRKRAPSKLYYGDKEYILSGLVRCGCCGSLMTCETKVKDDKHSYNYLKCNKLRSKCSQKPLNEAKILAQLEKELSVPMNISDEMLKNIKAEVKKKLKEENQNTAALKRDITIRLNKLDEEAKNLFRGYVQGKCDEKMYSELKTEIELEKEKLQQDMNKYLEIDDNTDEMLANIAKVAANVGIFLKSPIISKKRDILRLILSDCKTDGKNLCFSIAKPFDMLLKTPEIEKWCGSLCDYRSNFYDDFKKLNRRIEFFEDIEKELIV